MLTTFIQIYFRMHHFVVKFSKFSSPQAINDPNLLHEADDDAVTWLESTETASRSTREMIIIIIIIIVITTREVLLGFLNN